VGGCSVTALSQLLLSPIRLPNEFEQALEPPPPPQEARIAVRQMAMSV
jgi:hypothetical protein